MPPRAVWKIRLSGGRAEPLDVRGAEAAATLDPRTVPCPEGAAAVPRAGCTRNADRPRGPYLNAGTRPFEAPARRQLDAPGLDIVGYPGQAAAFRFACVRLFLDDNRSAPDMKLSCSADIFRSRRKR